MTEKELKEENKVLKQNVNDLEKQLHDAYIRIMTLVANSELTKLKNEK